MSKDLLPALRPEDDGDFEHQHKIEMAKDLYMKGHSTEDVALRTELKKWTIHKYVTKGAEGERPWLEQRKDARMEFMKECQELTKISLSKAYRTTGDVLFKCLERATKELDAGNFKPMEQIQLINTLVKGVKEIHALFMPAMKAPLVNIALQQNPKLSEADIMEKLTDWGLEGKEDSGSQTP